MSTPSARRAVPAARCFLLGAMRRVGMSRRLIREHWVRDMLSLGLGAEARFYAGRQAADRRAPMRPQRLRATLDWIVVLAVIAAVYVFVPVVS